MDWKYLERVRWANDCQSCGVNINVNDHAYWKKGVGIRHTYCMNATDTLKFTNDELRRANLDLAAAIINSDTLEELQENISTRSLDAWVQSKQKMVEMTFPLCQRCGNSNDVPAVELCERCAIENVLSNWDTYVNDIERKKHDGPWHSTRTGYARRIVSRFRHDPVIKYRRYTPGVIQCFFIEDGGDRYKAIEDYGKFKGYTDKNAFLILIDQLGGILVDRSKRGNELFEVDMFQPENAKILRYRDPSTDEIYACFVPTDIITADAAMAWKFFLTEEEYDGLEGEA